LPLCLLQAGAMSGLSWAPWNGTRPFLRALERFQGVKPIFLQLDSIRRLARGRSGLLACEIFRKNCEHEVTPRISSEHHYLSTYYTYKIMYDIINNLEVFVIPIIP
jgi:hypothetical protein